MDDESGGGGDIEEVVLKVNLEVMMEVEVVVREKQEQEVMVESELMMEVEVVVET